MDIFVVKAKVWDAVNYKGQAEQFEKDVKQLCVFGKESFLRGPTNR